MFLVNKNKLQVDHPNNILINYQACNYLAQLKSLAGAPTGHLIIVYKIRPASNTYFLYIR